jgi:hypothetical protein
MPNIPRRRCHTSELGVKNRRGWQSHHTRTQQPWEATESPQSIKKAITGTNRIHLVLFGMQHRTLNPYLVAMNRSLISVMKPKDPLEPRTE